LVKSKGVYLKLPKELHELSLFFSEAKELPFEYTKSSYPKLQKLIFETTQIQGLQRPKISEMKQLNKSFGDLIAPQREYLLVKLFDYRNFPNSARAKAAAAENTASSQKKEKPANHRAIVYTRIASARKLEKSNHDVSVKDENALEGGSS
jgi:hypothetical protein